MVEPGQPGRPIRGPAHDEATRPPHPDAATGGSEETGHEPVEDVVLRDQALGALETGHDGRQHQDTADDHVGAAFDHPGRARRAWRSSVASRSNQRSTSVRLSTAWWMRARS